MTTIYPDTNVWLAVGSGTFSLFEEIKRVVLEPCVIALHAAVEKELARLAKEDSKRGQYARVAQQIIAKEQVPLRGKNSFQTADDAFLELTTQEVVITSDKLLKKACAERGIRVMFIKQKRILGI
ncbi:MAG: hypothetical protein H6502_03595 [Candidatus Woesearchaeota archaeon]|nr:MAG: hypothetical protein H6502_03595 [Candidatus Woesearchaeota archaeon]